MTGTKGMNKSQAARAAIDAGHEKPRAAVEYIKDEFGIDMNPQHFSAIKSHYKKSLVERNPGKKAGTPGKEAASRAAEGYVAPPTKPRSPGEPDMLLALEGIRALVEHYGAERLKRMVDLMS